MLTLVPDAASYGLRNGIFGFHWNILATPGSSYAVGFCLLAAALMVRWSKEGRPRPLWVAIILAAGTLLIRIQAFAVAFPALLLSAAMSTRLVQRRTLPLLVAAIVAFAIFVFGFYALADAWPALELFLDAVHSRMEPTAYGGWYERLLQSQGRGIGVPAGILLVFPAFLGILVVLYPASVLLARRSRGLTAIDLLPAAFLGLYLLLLITAPVAQHADSTEFAQRPFVTIYAVVSIWTAAGFINWIAARSIQAAHRTWVTLLLASALGLVIVWPQSADMGKVAKPAWAWPYYGVKVEDGLPQAAAFLRARATPGDIFAVQQSGLGWVATDAATNLVAMTGLPTYLSRPFIYLRRGGERERIALQRYAELAQVARERNAAGARDRLRRLGIQWYVAAGSQGPLWDRARQQASFVAGEIAVYSFK